MSRRDTIIIAVLINAGLLAILFVMAISTDEEKVTAHPEIEQVLANAQVSPQPTNKNDAPSPTMEQQPADEFDHVLNELAITELPEPILIEDLSAQESRSSSDESSSMATIAEPPQKTEVERVSVTVKRGDSLEKIAKANGTTVSAIMKANNLKSEKLKIGQVLQVPVPSKNGADKPAKPSSTSPKTGDGKDSEYYVIKSGDNPWKIAKKFHVKFDDLLKLNNLDEEKARNMKVGDKIRIR